MAVAAVTKSPKRMVLQAEMLGLMCSLLGVLGVHWSAEYGSASGLIEHRLILKVLNRRLNFVWSLEVKVLSIDSRW